MLKEFEERIQNAKDKQFLMLERFHIGDVVYPFWLKEFIVYGIVTDVDTVARKVFCDFNGVNRQFCPEDLMHVNPELINASTVKKRNASVDETQGVYPPDTDNGIRATCKSCGGEIAVSYDEHTAKSDFVCTKCGKRIPEDNLSKETKKAMRSSQRKTFSAQNRKLAKSIARIARDIMRCADAEPDRVYCLSGNVLRAGAETDSKSVSDIKNELISLSKRLLNEAGYEFIVRYVGKRGICFEFEATSSADDIKAAKILENKGYRRVKTFPSIG